MTFSRGLHLAIEIAGDGADTAAIEARARAAEAAGFALVTVADSPTGTPPGLLEAGVRTAFLSRRTTRIGLAPQLHVTVTEPFHLATQLASLDHASLGRAGWVVGAASGPDAYATVGEPLLTGPDLRQEIADVIDVTRQLWDSWEDDAVIRDRTTGRFLDPDRVHHVGFTGARWSVVGPLITPRPPQGQIVVLGADTLGVTDRLDVALIAAPTFDEVADRARAATSPLTFAELETGPAGPQPTGRLRWTGDPAGLRDLLDRLGGVVDGVRLHLGQPADLSFFTEAAEARPGPTLREVLGLARPANRCAAA